MEREEEDQPKQLGNKLFLSACIVLLPSTTCYESNSIIPFPAIIYSPALSSKPKIFFPVISCTVRNSLAVYNRKGGWEISGE